MRYYGAIIKAQPGWRVVLTDYEGNPHFIAIEQWGVPLEVHHNIVHPKEWLPLDDFGECFLDKKNFVEILTPHETENGVIDRCFNKAVGLGWIQQ
jgi:hypothetical protein